MSNEIEIEVPAVGESISEVFIGEWYIGEGAFAAMDANVVGLETDKATFDVPAPVDGTITRVLKVAGETAAVGEVIGFMTASQAPAAAPPPVASSSPSAPPSSSADSGHVMPAAERMMKENSVASRSVSGSGPGGGS